MRGAHTAKLHSEQLVGIIPADAGSTRDNGGYGFRDEDHPRGCGEHFAGECRWCGE